MKAASRCEENSNSLLMSLFEALKSASGCKLPMARTVPQKIHQML
nr:MAG TPA: hypothetical protein [Caudoviricetes sp.]